MKSYRPVAYRQLFMIVKTLLQREPAMDDAEWKAKTRETLEKMGFDEPDPHTLVSAMNQVEHGLRQTVGPRLSRPVPTPPEPEPMRAPVPDRPEPKGRTSQPLGWDIVLKLVSRLGTSPRSGRFLPGKCPEPSQILGITEEAALDEFWRQQRDGADRLSLLRAFAEIALLRPAGWDYDRIRADARAHRLAVDGCFVCRAKKTSDWHHVIQIQHGGSNYLRNRVCLCEACHREVHPWLPAIGRKVGGGWCQVGIIELPHEMRKKEPA